MLSKATTSWCWKFWPSPVALTLLSRTSSGATSDTLASGVTQPTCRQTPVARLDFTAAGGLLAAESSTNWQVWDRGQASFPKVGDVLVEGGGTRWSIKAVRVEIFSNLYVCTCVKEIT